MDKKVEGLKGIQSLSVVLRAFIVHSLGKISHQVFRSVNTKFQSGNPDLGWRVRGELQLQLQLADKL